MSMDATPQQPIAHSAIVHIQLLVNGFIMPVSQLGPNFLILRNPIDHPPVDAEITMSIDNHIDRWRVFLPDGIQSAKRETVISKS